MRIAGTTEAVFAVGGDAAAADGRRERSARAQGVSAAGQGAALSLQLRASHLLHLRCLTHDVPRSLVQEVLMQLEKEERQQKLEETFQSVCDDYRRILAMAKI